MREESVINNLPEYWKKIFYCAKEKIVLLMKKRWNFQICFLINIC